MAVVAARQRKVARVPAAHARAPPSGRLTPSAAILALVVGLLLAGALDVATPPPASAQGFTYNPRPPGP